MTRNNYLKRVLQAALFYLAVLLLSEWAYSDTTNFRYFYILYAVASALLFPFAYNLLEKLSKKLVSIDYWNRGMAILCYLFAIPLGLISLMAYRKKA